MTNPLPHISVCVCTFRRPQALGRLLGELARQETGGRFTYSVVVADNDADRSAEEVVAASRAAPGPGIVYCVEPEQNIALARNRALQNAEGDYIAFIDDDEFPGPDWLALMFATCREHAADGVLGPVLPHFEGSPPRWVTKGGFCDRPTHETGFRIDWNEGRTGNLLFQRGILEGTETPFLPEFGSGGEDRNFFRRMIGEGRVFVWCKEAAVHESIPPVRWKRSFMLRRALLRGKMSLGHRRGPADLAKSALAVAGYTLALPVCLVMGQHLFMRYLIKTCDHAGKLLAFAGVNPIRERYVMD